MRKLKTKLVACFLVVILIPLILLGIVSYKQSKSILESNLKLTSEQTLEENNKGFEQFLKTLVGPIDVASHLDPIKHFDDGEAGTGDELVTSAQNTLHSSQRSIDGAIKCYYVSEGGLYVSKSEEDKEFDDGSQYKEKDWYKTAIKDSDAKPVYTKPYTDEKTGKKIITVAQASTAHDKAVGVIACDIEAEKLESYVQNINILNSGFAVLVDSDGNILVDNDNNTYAKDNIKNLQFWNEAKSQDEGTFVFEDNGKSVYVTEKTNLDTGWKIIGFVNEDEISSSIAQIRITTIITIILASIFGILISVVISRYVNRNITIVNDAMKKVSEGDFTEKIDIKSNDEFNTLGVNFNFMIENISRLMHRVNDASVNMINVADNISEMSKETTQASTNMSSAIEQVANGANNQAKNTKEVNCEVENLSEKLDKAKDYTNQISGKSSATQKLSSKGLDMLNELVEKSNKTRDNANITNEIVTDMSKSIEKIKYISDAIAEITEQTNLLSLNAGIEAARAGYAGKGFEVVAEEIRELAEESRKSTDEIKNIVNEIAENSLKVKDSMNESNKILNDETEAVNETKDVFKGILESVNELINSIKSIKGINDEMYEAKNVVIDNMENIAVISEETASVTEELTASSEEVNATMNELSEYAGKLYDMSKILKSEIGKFKLIKNAD